MRTNEFNEKVDQEVFDHVTTLFHLGRFQARSANPGGRYSRPIIDASLRRLVKAGKLETISEKIQNISGGGVGSGKGFYSYSSRKYFKVIPG